MLCTLLDETEKPEKQPDIDESKLLIFAIRCAYAIYTLLACVYGGVEISYTPSCSIYTMLLGTKKHK